MKWQSKAWFDRNSEEPAMQSETRPRCIEHGRLNFRVNATLVITDATDAHWTPKASATTGRLALTENTDPLPLEKLLD